MLGDACGYGQRMTGSANRDELVEELESIERSLRRLRRERGGPGDEVGDQADDATDLTGYGEDQALIENLETRRAAITAQLGGSEP